MKYVFLLRNIAGVHLYLYRNLQNPAWLVIEDAIQRPDLKNPVWLVIEDAIQRPDLKPVTAKMSSTDGVIKRLISSRKKNSR